MSETKIRFIKDPSLATLGSHLTRRFGKSIGIRRTPEGLEFTVDGDLTPGDKTRLEIMMERFGYIMEEG